ncbi:MFS transporter [Marinibactrum halimedae]|uniref:Sugar efflux transporter SetB n=1 Tax=Marinibactrum halimedae TaxID=1444977 RepID=A0AA37TAP1_9GAMM|nr:MFS transporter [Marinibactrum halimedae]MCD9458516.1 MFS transporter [Marinibactrum halimedae]GLS26620.1 sugar efflux transporter SetB [Marinibactrum halimedae]
MSSSLQILKGPGWVYCVLSGLTGLVGAFVHPVMSFFLVEGLNVQPIWIGVYTISVTLAGMGVSQWLGALADRGVSARKLYMAAIFAMSIALLLFSVVRSFLWVWLAGITFMAIAAAATPQMLTLGRQWVGEQKQINIAQFNALVRAAISMAWIAGPPLAFGLVAWFGFSGSFLAGFIVALMAAGFVWWRIPEHKKGSSNSISKEQATTVSSSFWLLGAVMFFGSMGNIMYSSSLPLYTVKELGLPTYLPGLCMGLVAGLEIMVMVNVGRLTVHFSPQRLMAFGFFCAITFYGLIFYATQPWEFLALQGLNAIFYGLYAGLGLTIMQAQLPKRIGFTSSFYSNAMKFGMAGGTTGAGIIAQYSSFHFASLGSFSAALCGLMALVGFVLLKKRESQIME